VTVIVAFALAGGPSKSHEATPSGPPPPITAAPPPSNAAAEAPCARVLSALPTKLGPLDPRAVHTKPDSPFVVAWGDPPVVLRCGVARPAALTPGSSEPVILLGVYWLPVQEKDATVFTSVDRSVYVEVRVPKKIDYQPLPILGQAIASKLKAICAVPEDGSTYRPDQLCTHRQ
jgi:hypothetical protein